MFSALCRGHGAFSCGHGVCLGFFGLLAYIANQAVECVFCFRRVHAFAGLQIDQVHAHHGDLAEQGSNHGEQYPQARDQAHAGTTTHHHAHHAAAHAAAVTIAAKSAHAACVGGNAHGHACQRHGGWHQACKQHHANQREDDVEHHFHQHHFNQALAGNAQDVGQSRLDGQAAPQGRAHQRADDPDQGDQQSGCDENQNGVGYKGQNAAKKRDLADKVNDGGDQPVNQGGRKYDQADQNEFGQAQQTGRSGRCKRANWFIFCLVHQHDANRR